MTYADFVIAQSQKRSAEYNPNRSVSAASNNRSPSGSSNASISSNAVGTTNSSTRGASDKTGGSVGNSQSARTEVVQRQDSVSLNLYEKIWHY